MTLKVMDGFETSRQDSDLRTRGYTNWTGIGAVVSPSSTGVNGFGVSQLTPANTDHTDFPFSTSSATSSFGFCPGLTINSLWNSGGFAFGISARSNLGVNAAYGSGQMSNSCQATFDGTNYWAIRVVGGSTYSIAYSPDLINWTVTATTPPITLQANATIAALGGGIIAVINTVTQTTTLTVYYTNNQGASWSSQVLGSTSLADSTGVAMATGNSAFPHAVLIGPQVAGNSTSLYVGTLGGTMTLVANATSTTGQIFGAVPRIIGGLLVFMTFSNQIMTATASNSALNTSAAWTTTAAWNGTTVYPTDIAYNPVSNLWVVSTGAGGMYTAPNAGAAGTPVALTGTPVFTQRYSTVGMQNVFWNGSVLVATGLSGHIITSPDGITWTEAGSKILPIGTANYDYRTVVYDGSRYVIFTDATTGCIVTTPDGVNNYQCVYTSDKGFSAGGTTDANGIVAYAVSAAPTIPTSVAAAYVIGTKAYVLSPQAVSGGSITAYLSLEVIGTSITAAKTVTVATGVATRSQATHYYEFVYTKNAATSNQFTFTLYVDGVLQYTDAAFQFATTTDTTSMPFIGMPGTQCVSQWDDMYFNVIDGQGVSGVLGPVSIVARRPTTDVQAQWTKTGTAASNSLTVNQLSASAQSANYLTSPNAGDKDIYTSTDTLPVGYSAKAVQVEGYYARTGATAPVVNIGIKSGSTESDGANFTVSSTTPMVTTLVLDKDPNGGVAWTNAAVLATQIVNSHIS